MIFKNAIALKVSEWPDSLYELNDRLQKHLIRKPTALEMGTVGWHPVYSEIYVVYADTAQFITMAINEKLIPASIVTDMLDEEVKAWEIEQDKPIPKSRKRHLKEAIIEKLKAVALVKKTLVTGFIWGNYLILNTASTARAEIFYKLLRQTLESMPGLPLPIQNIQTRLTFWAQDIDNLPSEIYRHGSYVIKSLGDNRSTRLQGHFDEEGHGPEVHLEDDDVITEMGLNLFNATTFTVNNEFIIKKIDFIGLDPTDRDTDDPFLLYVADLLLTYTQLISIFTTLEAAFED